MIRDPSDGSVREPQKSAPLRRAPQIIAECLPSSDAAGGGADTASGLPAGSTRPESVARLEKSREWLKDYHRSKSMEQGKENGGCNIGQAHHDH